MRFINGSRIRSMVLLLILTIMITFPVNTTRAMDGTNSDKLRIYNWEYCWGDSGTNNEGVPLRALEYSGGGWNKSNGIFLYNTDNGKVLWLRAIVRADEVENTAVYFEQILADKVDIYVDGQYMFSSEDSKLVSGSNSIVNIIVPAGNKKGEVILALRVSTETNKFIGIHGRIESDSYKTLIKELSTRNINGVVFGFFFIFLAMSLFIILIFLKKQEKGAIVSLGIAILSTGLWNIIGSGNSNIFIPEAPVLLDIIYTIASMLTPIGFAYFFEKIFGTGYRAVVRRLWQVFSIYAVLFMIVFSLNYIFKGRLSNLLQGINNLYFLLLIVEVIIINIMALIFAVQGNIDAKIFTAGSLVLALSAVIYSINFLLFRRSSFVISIGIFFFVIFLIILLARHFIDDHRRLELYSEELESKNRDLNRSRDEISLLNQTLEERVVERTKQIEKTNAELKKTLDTLQMTQEQLVESEKMVSLGRLVAGVAHEINTPVGVSVTAASYLDESTREFQELYSSNTMKRSDLGKYLNTCRETTGVVLANLQRASELIKSFKQVAVDQSSESIRQFSIKKYIDEILLNLRPTLKKTKHVIGINCDEDITIESYPGALSQIVTNLVMNSLIHGFDEGDEGTIIFDISKNGHEIEIIYSDNGKGIPKDIIKKIFDPFFTTKRGQGGTGLGLNIVYNIVTQKLKGTIRCESILGNGTKFIINIPTEKGDNNESR